VIAKALNPNIRVVGVRTALYASLHNSLKGLRAPVGGVTLAEGVAVPRVGDLNLAVGQVFIDDVLLVEEDTRVRSASAARGRKNGRRGSRCLGRSWAA
jgi:threonine dehydratase